MTLIIPVVSIRSPRRNEGRPKGQLLFATAVVFQSAPPVETRGDFNVPNMRGHRPSVSIRSPRRNEGRPTTSTSTPPSAAVSIRSPRRNEGRPRVQAGLSQKKLFQSAPPVETRGDHRRGRGWGVGHNVSIRSPRRNEGRQQREQLEEGLRKFQSAPPVETRGDGGDTATMQDINEFQSAPPVETRGDNQEILL